MISFKQYFNEALDVQTAFFWILPKTKEIVPVPIFEHDQYVLKNYKKFGLPKPPKEFNGIKDAINAGAVRVSIIDHHMTIAGFNPSIRNKIDQLHQLIKRYNVTKVIGDNYIGAGMDWFVKSPSDFLKMFYESKNPDIKKGDTILVGRWKNSPAIVKGFGKDKNKQPTVKTNKGTYSLYRFRIKKLLESFNPWLFNPFEKLEGKTLVFFDTETTGLHPYKDQLTEIGAIAVDGATLEEKDNFHEVIRIHKQDADPAILAMTHYDPTKATTDEMSALKDFVAFVAKQTNPILVAHNASFDMKMVRSKIAMPRYPVYDTLVFAKQLLVPTLTVLKNQGNEKATKMLEALSRINKWGKRVVSATLGALTNAYSIDNTNWHSGLADTQNLVQVFKGIKAYYDKAVMKDPAFRQAYTKAVKSRRWLAKYGDTLRNRK